MEANGNNKNIMNKGKFLFDASLLAIDYQLQIVIGFAKDSFLDYKKNVIDAYQKNDVKELERFYKYLCKPLLGDPNFKAVFLDKIGFIPEKRV